jgi:tetratricopeptide (TPR) repeat protein
MRMSGAVWLIVLAACAAGVGSLVPARIDVRPLAADLAGSLAAARQQYERGAAPAALAELESVLQAHPDLVDAQRLRQDVLRSRGRAALLRAEAEARVQRAPADATAHYLLGRLLAADAQEAAFRRAVELAPESVWPWLGYAYALRDRDPAESLAIYERLYAAADRHPVVGVAFAHALRSNGRLPEAIAVYERLAEAGDPPGVGQLGLAQTFLAMGGPAERMRSWAALALALRQRPFDSGVHALVRELLRAGMADEQVEHLVDVLREDPARMQDFATGDGAAVLATLLQRLQQPAAALAVLEAVGTGARQPQLRQRQRRLLLALGDVAGFLSLLRGDLPAGLIDDEANQVRGLWLALLTGPWAAGDPLGSGERAVGLACALRDVGLLTESEAVAEQARRRHPGDAPQLCAVRDEVRAELAFENALRRLLYLGYAQHEAPSFDDVLMRVREVSRTIFGKDVVGEVVRFSVPLVGEMLDPFAADLCTHLARYNRHLVLGRRSGGVTEGLLLTRLSVRDLPDDADLPLPGRCREVIGMDRDVRSLSGVLGGDLAGVALLSHYVIDYDAVLEWSLAIAERRRIARADGDAVLRDPLPVDADPLEPLDVSWRLAALSSLQDSELDLAVLDVIRRHERRHLVDSFHYLPFEDNLWRGLGLLLGFGLSPAAIEAEMERRAELAALATSPHLDVVLAHVADFLGEPDPDSPHVVGFGRLGRELVEELVADGVPAEAARAAAWHGVDRAAVHRAARRLFAGLPGARRD